MSIDTSDAGTRAFQEWAWDMRRFRDPRQKLLLIQICRRIGMSRFNSFSLHTLASQCDMTLEQVHAALVGLYGTVDVKFTEWPALATIAINYNGEGFPEI